MVSVRSAVEHAQHAKHVKLRVANASGDLAADEHSSAALCNISYGKTWREFHSSIAPGEAADLVALCDVPRHPNCEFSYFDVISLATALCDERTSVQIPHVR